ncbi:SLC13 family permease [Sporolituus thermophilus]|uniref:Possible tyrosine transporter P-protein n=1 Tax=Sporolituus thermophilus DSM 23256 TaxID=1123285 RepID=A0A1G7J7H0_9FIRM|nr:ArsB/NhaD family transporter [Sporolituus thermophilus]SDF20828.1 possible tyrosine transporter P-protein [Sporolituus thermophilus DSM 23256]
MNGQMALMAVIVFVATYGIIVSEKIHRTKIALVGALVLLLIKIMPQEEAIAKVDFNTLGLLIGMMIIVAIAMRTGMFQYMAVKLAKRVRGNPVRIMSVFFAFTAVTSAFLDNVTTVLLVTPIIFSITGILKINPVPFLISEIMASNIGGTATLIGDPPNIMIGGATGLTFNDFVINLTPVIIIIGFVTNWLFLWLYRKELVVDPAAQQGIMQLDEESYLTDKALLRKVLIVLALTIGGFVAHGPLGFESATIAMGGAAILLLISGIEPEEIFRDVEWNTIFFFIGLFILVGGLEVTGVIRMIAEWGLAITHSDVLLMNVLILWLSAIASAFIDNIPFVATMIPLIKAVNQISGIDVSAMWWALSLGACLGGNGTIIGASANVVVSSMAASRGYPMTFVSYLKIAFPLMLVSIVISNIYIYFVYLR